MTSQENQVKMTLRGSFPGSSLWSNRSQWHVWSYFQQYFYLHKRCSSFPRTDEIVCDLSLNRLQHASCSRRHFPSLFHRTSASAMARQAMRNSVLWTVKGRFEAFGGFRIGSLDVTKDQWDGLTYRITNHESGIRNHESRIRNHDACVQCRQSWCCKSIRVNQ